ncbi:MAG: hypothetical protein QM599_12625 [Pseudoxanthomonas sp.]
MKTRRLPTLPLLLAASGLGVMALLSWPRSSVNGVAATAGSVSMIPAADDLPEAAPRHLPRRRNAMSMPYFSFARSLRSRS